MPQMESSGSILARVMHGTRHMHDPECMVINGSDVAWSCVVDDTPEIWSSIVPWLATAIGLAGIKPALIHIHHVCSLRREVADLCRELEVNTHAIEPFDPRYPHTNKIRQCTTDFMGVRRVVLTDVDVAFAKPPPLGEIQAPVAGKIVDRPNPPVDILRDIFASAGVSPLGICKNAYVDSSNVLSEFETLLGNYNGGLYVIEREYMGRIAETWTHWARWLVANVHLLGRWTKHTDQVSFCLAVSELRMTVGVLDDAWNFPLHLNVAASETEPFILHHHARLNDDLRLRQTSAAYTQEAIRRVNDAIASFQRQHWKLRMGF